MNLKRSTLNPILIASLTLLLIVIVVAVGARKWPLNTMSGGNSPQKKKDERVTYTLPPVISSINGIEVVSAFIDGNGTANITVVNKTGKGIVGLAISSGNLMFSDDNALAQDNPETLIPPYSSYTLQQSASNLRANQPLRVSAAFYNDGTEEGDAAVRENIRDTRAREKEKRLLQSKKPEKKN